MSPSRRSLERRLIASQALDEFMPIFPVYALLFAENGLSSVEISGLFVLWSVVTFVLEVPSGAWADTVSRRLLLCLSSVTYDELAAIGAHEARGREHRSEERARSGLPGERSERASSVSSRYARVIGVGTSAALVTMALATLLAAPLVALGGYALAGWMSCGGVRGAVPRRPIAAVHACGHFCRGARRGGARAGGRVLRRTPRDRQRTAQRSRIRS